MRSNASVIQRARDFFSLRFTPYAGFTEEAGDTWIKFTTEAGDLTLGTGKQGERTLLVPLPAEGTNLPSWLCELLTGILGAPDAPALPDPGRPEQRRAAS